MSKGCFITTYQVLGHIHWDTEDERTEQNDAYVGNRNGGGISQCHLTLVELVWKTGNVYSPQTVTQKSFFWAVCWLTLKVKFVLADLMSLFAWTPKSGHKNLYCLWWYSSFLSFECGALCGIAAGLDVERPCWVEANHSLVLLYSFHADFYPAFCIPRTLMASTHVNHNIYITEVKTGKCVHSLVGHRRTPWCVTFHPTIPGLIASGCLDGEVRIWDLHVSLSWNSYTFRIGWVVDLFSLKLFPKCCPVRNLFGSFT